MKIEIEDPIIRQNVEYLEKTYNLEFFEYETKMINGKPHDKIGFTDKTTGLKWRNMTGLYEFLAASLYDIMIKILYVKIDGEKYELEFLPYDWHSSCTEWEISEIKKHYDVDFEISDLT